MSTMGLIDAYLHSDLVRPHVGWHDEHRQHDGTPAYMPALQQVRSEFVSLLAEIERRRLRVSCLQLGLGPSGGPAHFVWAIVFERVVTIDVAKCLVDQETHRGRDTHSYESVSFASERGPYDFLFIDAGHTLQDVASDYFTYRPMVRRGGLIAFHDALPRERYPEIEVHEFIKTLPVTILGDEVGTAVMEVK